MAEKEREIASIINRFSKQILAVEVDGEKVVLTDAHTGKKHGELSLGILNETVKDGAAFKVFCYKDELPWD
jgi:hypothetical protein